jgi:hypothetical protein
VGQYIFHLCAWVQSWQVAGFVELNQTMGPSKIRRIIVRKPSPVDPEVKAVEDSDIKCESTSNVYRADSLTDDRRLIAAHRTTDRREQCPRRFLGIMPGISL